MMKGIRFYREASLPHLEAKWCSLQDLCYKKHFHEELSVGIIDRGTTRVWYEGKELQGDEGSVVCFPPYMPHACNPAPDSGWTYKMLFIHPAWIKAVFPDGQPGEAPFLMEHRQARGIGEAVNRCVRAFDGLLSPMEIEAGFIELLPLLGCDSGGKAERREAAEPKHVKRIKEYIHEHYQAKITLSDLENATGLSKYHLSHLFKKGSHLPPHAYQNLLRINYVKKELCKRRPIADIGAEAGFYDQSHLTRTFLQTVGVTPQKYAAAMQA